LLTSYRNKKLNKLGQLTQPLTSRYFTSLSSGPKRELLWWGNETRSFPSFCLPSLKLVTVYFLFRVLSSSEAATSS
jgi:hypothetical protein